MTSKTLAVALFAASIALPTAAFADAAAQIKNAADHAGYAAKAANVAGVHMHLHHAVNCLVGPKGAGYAAEQMNPCANLGNGAIPDTADAAKKKALEDALAKANAGIAEQDLAAAQKDAGDAAEALKAIH